MIRQVKIYVEDKPLDLFNDEQIVVNSAVKTVGEIDTTLTDLSQDFTIPCSPNNNAIFEHYYQNDVDATIDSQIRRDGRIEIQGTLFRYGKIAIQSAQTKNGRADNYKVTFYGNVVTLKDLIGEDKLSSLDYSDLNHDYSGSEIQTRITTDSTTTDYDVRYPLISSQRVWQHGDSTTNDISIVGGAIDYTELFPAVRVKSLFDLIASKYGVMFSGSFLNNTRFTDLFLWFKNKNNFTFYSAPIDITFGIGNPTSNPLRDSVVYVESVQPNSLIYSPYDNVINILHGIVVTINTASSVDYYLDVYKDGAYYFSSQGNGTQTFPIITLATNSSFLNAEYTFKLRSTSSMSFDADVDYGYSYTLVDNGTFPITLFPDSETWTENSGTLSTTAYIDLASLAPDMKILDFLSGIFKAQNLTCYSTDNLDYKIRPLEQYYSAGKRINITKYVNTDEITYERPKLYRNISFEYEDSLSFMNREFYDLFSRKYGDLSSLFPYDGDEYTVKLPFENLLFNKFTGTNIQVAYSLETEPDYKPYIPKPVLIYINDLVSITSGTLIKFNNGSSIVNITSYIPFGQDALQGTTKFSSNFGSEISSFYWTVVDKSFYQTYYEPQFVNLYNRKTRLVYVKCVLPMNILQDIKMNDKILIRDKKYIINSMSSNLTTGEVNLVLLNNWRDEKFTENINLNVNSDGGDFVIGFDIPSIESVTINSPIETPFSSTTSTTISGDTTATFTIDPNTSGVERINTYPLAVFEGRTRTRYNYLTITQEA